MSKRMIDVLFASLGLLLCGPLLVGLAVWVKIDSRGPVFFRQERVGLGGKLFRIHKFRTMRHDAPGSGPAITASGDARITRAGHFLRRYKLDELPQLIDVLKGDMSLVGPRPEVPMYVARYPPGTKEKVLSVKPGITDEASILYMDESRVLAEAEDPEWSYIHEVLPVKLRLYEQYADNHSLQGDIRIIGKTILGILGRTQG